MRLRHSLVAGLAALVLAPGCAARPPADSEAAQSAGWDPRALEGGARILWQAEVGPGHSSVVVDGGRVYTMGSATRDAGQEQDVDLVWCLRLDTGEVVWRYAYPCPEIYFAGPRATPVLAEGLLYTLSWDGQVHCLDAGDGSLVWRADLVASGLAEPGHWGLCGSPVVDGDLLVLTAGGTGVALDRATGEVVWSGAAGETPLPSPVLVDGATRRLAVVPGLEEWHAVDASDGTEVWSLPRDAEYHLEPALVGGHLVLPATLGVAVLDVSADEPRVLSSTGRARFSAFQHYAVHEGFIYGFDRDALQCVELSTGERMWRTKVGMNGSLLLADGMLIVLHGDGRLSIAEATSDRWTERSSAQAIQLPSNRGLPQPSQHHCWTRPVLAGGKIIVRSNQGSLVCVDVSPRQG